jgi:hypothetical protein
MPQISSHSGRSNDTTFPRCLRNLAPSRHGSHCTRGTQITRSTEARSCERSARRRPPPRLAGAGRAVWHVKAGGAAARKPRAGRGRGRPAGCSKVRVARVPVDFSLATSTSCTTTPSLPVHSKHQLQHCVVHLRLFLSNFQSRVPVFMAKWNFALSFSPFLLQFQAETVLLLRTRQTELRSFALSAILYHTICALLLLACK